MPTDPIPSNDVTALPLLPLRDVVVFPHMVIPLFVGRPKSIKALDVAMDAGKHILLVAQKLAAKDDPAAEDLYAIGSVATVLQMLKLPDGTVKVLVEGAHARASCASRTRASTCRATAHAPGDRARRTRSRRCAARCSRSSTST
jgi:ATP-dependent Lon protease